MLQKRIRALFRKLPDPIRTFAVNGAFLADTFPYQRAGVMIQDACLGNDINLKALDCLARGRCTPGVYGSGRTENL